MYNDVKSFYSLSRSFVVLGGIHDLYEINLPIWENLIWNKPIGHLVLPMDLASMFLVISIHVVYFTGSVIIGVSYLLSSWAFSVYWCLFSISSSTSMYYALDVSVSLTLVIIFVGLSAPLFHVGTWLSLIIPNIVFHYETVYLFPKQGYNFFNNFTCSMCNYGNTISLLMFSIGLTYYKILIYCMIIINSVDITFIWLGSIQYAAWRVGSWL